jgi:hypothetical protein
MLLLCPLAQSTEMARAIGWSLVLIVLLVLGFVAVARLRRWLKEDDDEGDAPVATGFSLSDLRRLHRQGQMTDEEFERARAKMMASAKAMAAKLPDPLARNRRRPPAAPDGGDPPDPAV